MLCKTVVMIRLINIFVKNDLENLSLPQTGPQHLEDAHSRRLELRIAFEIQKKYPRVALVLNKNVTECFE